MANANDEAVPLDGLFTACLEKVDAALQRYDQDVEESDLDIRPTLTFLEEELKQAQQLHNDRLYATDLVENDDELGHDIDVFTQQEQAARELCDQVNAMCLTSQEMSILEKPADTTNGKLPQADDDAAGNSDHDEAIDSLSADMTTTDSDFIARTLNHTAWFGANIKSTVSNCHESLEGTGRSINESLEGTGRFIMAAIFSALRKEPRPDTSDTASESEESFTDCVQYPSSSVSDVEPTATLVVCISCTEEVPVGQTLKTECEPNEHTYCSQCTTTLFEKAIGDRRLPPKCCGKSINTSMATRLMPAELSVMVDKKTLEFSTAEPIYCANGLCAAFIPTSAIDGSVAGCDECGCITCVYCKSPEHSGECESDEGEAMGQLRQKANAKGWKHCYRCKRFVELATGCNHIT